MFDFVIDFFRFRRALKRARHQNVVLAQGIKNLEDCLRRSGDHSHQRDEEIRKLKAQLSLHELALRRQRNHVDRMHGEVLDLLQLRDSCDANIRQKLEDFWKARGDA